MDTSTSTPATADAAPAAAASMPESSVMPAPVVPISPAPEAPRKRAYGSLIGIILIVAVIIFGAFYAWGQRLALQEHGPAAEMP